MMDKYGMWIKCATYKGNSVDDGCGSALSKCAENQKRALAQMRRDLPVSL